MGHGADGDFAGGQTKRYKPGDAIFQFEAGSGSNYCLIKYLTPSATKLPRNRSPARAVSICSGLLRCRSWLAWFWREHSLHGESCAGELLFDGGTAL